MAALSSGYARDSCRSLASRLPGSSAAVAAVALAAACCSDHCGVAIDAVLLLGAHLLLGVAHEFAHVLAACALGVHGAMTWSNARSAFVSRRVHIPAAKGFRANAIRHAGWVASGAIAVIAVACSRVSLAFRLAAVVTAVEALATDLLGMPEGAGRVRSGEGSGWFLCGNFGILLLTPEGRKWAYEILQQMVRVTMMRGAQSGGVVTYVNLKGNGDGDITGRRSRVVNGKRSDLSELVVNKLSKDMKRAKELDGEQIFAGHTRFATSSIAELDGTHPHQWSPPERLECYVGFIHGRLQTAMRTVEMC